MTLIVNTSIINNLTLSSIPAHQGSPLQGREQTRGQSQTASLAPFVSAGDCFDNVGFNEGYIKRSIFTL